MNSSRCKLDNATSRRRYLVHLSLVQAAGEDSQQYVVCIEPWAGPSKGCSKQSVRQIRDECALVEVMNPLLPCGSDVRDVLSHIESSGGFFYLLQLTAEEAQRLGWRE